MQFYPLGGHCAGFLRQHRVSAQGAGAILFEPNREVVVRIPIRVTFDTNTYNRVGRPQLNRLFRNLWPPNRDRIKSARDRLCWWYLNWCTRRGRIIAAIPEGVRHPCQRSRPGWPRDRRAAQQRDECAASHLISLAVPSSGRSSCGPQ